MGRYMAELGMPPASRSRVAALDAPGTGTAPRIELVVIRAETGGPGTGRSPERVASGNEGGETPEVTRFHLDGRL
jgi:hypothetical protein